MFCNTEEVMTDGRICTLADVNGMTYEDFIARFGGVAEHGKLVAASVWICRPFRSVDHLCRTFGDFMDTLPDSGLSDLSFIFPTPT